MSTICNVVDDDILHDCDKVPVAGVKDEFYILNLSDIAGYTQSITNPLVIESIVLKTGANAFKWQGFNNSNKPSFELVKLTFSPSRYKHLVKPKVFSNDPATKLELYKLDNSRVVVIHQNNSKGTGGNEAFEIYGLDEGLKVDIHKRELDNADLQGGHEIELSTKDSELEKYPVRTYFNTNYATSLADILGLL